MVYNYLKKLFISVLIHLLQRNNNNITTKKVNLHEKLILHQNNDRKKIMTKPHFDMLHHIFIAHLC